MKSPGYVPRALHGIALMGALTSFAPGAMANVLIDNYRGQVYVPSPAITPNFDNKVDPNTPQGRHDAVQRLLAFAATSSNLATAVAGTSLTTTWPDLNMPTGSAILCEGASLTTDACKNRIQGAVMYTALLMPAQGNYTLKCGATGNDGTIVDLAPTQGTDYRNLGYSQGIASFCTANVSYGSNGTLASPAPNTLVNLRRAWNNWGNGAANIIQWVPPGGGPAVDIPASNLYDPSDPATYLKAGDDDFTATPFKSGTGGATASIFSNDRVNVATPVSASGATANIQTWDLDFPAGSGLTLNPDGTVSVAANVSPGTMGIGYKICRTDTKPQPLCARATVWIAVLADIRPQPDTGSATAGVANPQAVPNIAANDMVNGQDATLGAGGNATVEPLGAWPAGIALDPNTGAVSTSASVSAGTYTLRYQLCDRAAPPGWPTCVETTIVLTVRTPPAPVPTLSHWGLLLLGLLAATVGMRQMRRVG